MSETTQSIDVDAVKVAPACPRPCASCPWRLANQGSTPDPHKFYAPLNLKKLWRGLRAGARMTCHPTDPRMAEFMGYEALADRTVAHECAGSLVLVQREFMAFQAMCTDDPGSKKILAAYKKARPNGLTRDGLIAIMERGLLGGTALNPLAMAKPDLGDVEIGYPAIDVPAARRGAQ